MRLHRFYINKPLGEELVVDGKGEERALVHQLLRVFRYSLGDKVIFFSPHTLGSDSTYEIASLEGQAISFARKATSSNSIPSSPLILALALVKKDTFETVARCATELGVTHILPVLSARSEKKNLNFERLHVICTEAAEQSGRGDVPQILDITSHLEALDIYRDAQHLVGSLSGAPYTKTTSGARVVWIGPEGGWTEDEEALFKNHNATLVHLTPTTLKADTAAIAMLSHIVLS